MAARKAETKTPGSTVSKARAKSTVVGTDSQVKVASCDPPYEALTQQIGYLMSAITNQNSSKNNYHNGSKPSKGNGKSSNTEFQRPKRDRKDMKCWGCGGTRHSWRECSTPRQGNNLPFKPTNQNQNQNTGQNLNDQWGGGNVTLQSSPSGDQGGINIDRQLRQTEVSNGPECYNPIYGSEYWVEQMKQKLKLMEK